MTSETIGTGRPSQRKGQLIGLLALVILGAVILAIWGTEDRDEPDDSSAARIVDTGDEPFPCFGSAAESLPPGCSGPGLRRGPAVAGEGAAPGSIPAGDGPEFP